MSIPTFHDCFTMLVFIRQKTATKPAGTGERNGQRGTNDGFWACAAIVQRAGVCFPVGDEACS